jgi:hypothetical protein
MSGVVANQRLVELTVHEEHGEFYEDAGEFLPLRVWAVKGYDPEMIEAGAKEKDKRLHPVLGPTFRVNIIRGGHRGSKSVGKSDKLNAAGQMPESSGSASSSAALTGPTPQLALADAESSDSSSSSSSSRHKKSKKSKKSKKAKKAKKENRKRARSEEKASLSSNCFSGYIIIKRPCR